MALFERYRMTGSKALMLAIAIAIAVRVVAVGITSYAPIPNENGKPTSIHHPAPSSDLGHYGLMAKLYLDCGIVKIVKAIALGHYGMDVELKVERWLCDPAGQKHGMYDLWRMQISPPVFPLLITAFDYHEGHTEPLALLFIALGIVLVALWLWWLHSRKVPWIWLLALGFLPHLIWFSIS